MFISILFMFKKDEKNEMDEREIEEYDYDDCDMSDEDEQIEMNKNLNMKPMINTKQWMYPLLGCNYHNVLLRQKWMMPNRYRLPIIANFRSFLTGNCKRLLSLI